MMHYLTISETSHLPKYKQIVNAIEIQIAQGDLKKGDKLPSLNKVCLSLKVSRDTVLLAYDLLKKRGVVQAILGKGYYVKSTAFQFEEKIFLLFDELNAFKEDLYTHFLKAMHGKAQIDIYFHHFNPKLFEKLIQDNLGYYTQYVIMPSNVPRAHEWIQHLPKEEVYILDQTNEYLNDYPAIYQNFKQDISSALLQGKEILKKYETLILIFPGEKEPYGMVEGFEAFCQSEIFAYQIIHTIDASQMQKSAVYIIPNDRDLVQVIEAGEAKGWILGQDFGIISYNDTPLKKVVAGGITTISTDFKYMGNQLAQMLINNGKESIQNPSQLIFRKSI
jgi:DNA-binding transcriptional regulator YhcF (GntR family)